jgi:hypothetical protein
MRIIAKENWLKFLVFIRLLKILAKCKQTCLKKKSCCAKETLIPDSCCENEVISFEENQPKITEFVSFDLFSPAVLTSYAWQGFQIEAVSIQEKNKPEYAFESNAPPLYKLYTQYVFYG